MLDIGEVKIAVIGLGYVGLPLAVEFGKHFKTIGYDIDQNRVDELVNGEDKTNEVSSEELLSATQLSFGSKLEEIQECNVYIITVPTPIDNNKQPDLSPLKEASCSIATVMGEGDVVIYESTVYPGATEEVCVPVLEEQTGYKLNRDFFVGYSPERINPGDKKHRLVNIKKVTSGSNPDCAAFVDYLYSTIISAGTFQVNSIKVAEASKVIENTQRDLNIALINELAIIFNKLGIDTLDVLEAAGTKWNFLPFRPGLVGGHCIGVDPYYLTHKAQSLGYFPDIILSGRRINDGMGGYIAKQVIDLMLKKCIPIPNSKVLVLGFTFKENCPDVRNTRVIDIVKEIERYSAEVDVYDPWADCEEVEQEYAVKLKDELQQAAYDTVIIAVGHDCFKKMALKELQGLCKENNVIYDIKSIMPKDFPDGRL